MIQSYLPKNYKKVFWKSYPVCIGVLVEEKNKSNESLWFNLSKNLGPSQLETILRCVLKITPAFKIFLLNKFKHFKLYKICYWMVCCMIFFELEIKKIPFQKKFLFFFKLQNFTFKWERPGSLFFFKWKLRRFSTWIFRSKKKILTTTWVI